MKAEIQKEGVQKFNPNSVIFSVLFIVMMISIVPLSLLENEMIGILIWLVIVALALFYALRVEKQKKKHNVQTEVFIMSNSKWIAFFGFEDV